MEIINDIVSQPFTSEDEMKAISVAMDERRKLQKAEKVQRRYDAILTAQDKLPPSVAPERAVTERKPLEVISSTPSVAPERAYKPRKKREIF